ncbi:MAG: hypothetical protein JWR37_5201 [Mycobacterium sp.]|jgi:hypothetical protein|nr:hypothetical protein [Mycobacterium sp.]
MRGLRWVAAIVWVVSWRTVYLEIFRWHHLTKTLRFNPPPPLPGSGGTPRPGWPLILVRAGAVLAPPVFLAATLGERVRISFPYANRKSTDG